jgi:predicted MFS family arabinose efflux permease
LTSGYRAAFLIAGCGLIVGALLASLLPKLETPAAEPQIGSGAVDKSTVRMEVVES